MILRKQRELDEYTLWRPKLGRNSLVPKTLDFCSIFAMLYQNYPYLKTCYILRIHKHMVITKCFHLFLSFFAFLCVMFFSLTHILCLQKIKLKLKNKISFFIFTNLLTIWSSNTKTPKHDKDLISMGGETTASTMTRDWSYWATKFSEKITFSNFSQRFKEFDERTDAKELEPEPSVRKQNNQA